jgi:putative membrane protein
MNRFLISVYAILGAILMAIPAEAQWRGYGPGCGMMGWGHHGLLWPIPVGLLSILVILSIIWFVRSMARSRKDGTEDSAIEIVKKRYAKGEITREEFEKIKEDIAKT